jgi:hypothetical protein
MCISASLTSKGQVTIPKIVRDFLHVDTGDKVDFQIDHVNECVHMYGPQSLSVCLACEGKGALVQSKKECFLCLGTGKIPNGFKPMLLIARWRAQYDIDIMPTLLVDEIYSEGLYVPWIEIAHTSYVLKDLRRVNDSLVIYLFLQFVVHDRNTLKPGEFAYLTHLLKESPLKGKLNEIFQVESETNA